MQVQAFAQLLPRGVNRMDGEPSFTLFGNGAGSVIVDIAILDTGIQLSSLLHLAGTSFYVSSVCHWYVGLATIVVFNVLQ